MQRPTTDGRVTRTNGDSVVFEDVLIVSDGLVLIAEYQGRRFGVPATSIQPGSTIRRPGDRGRLVLAAHHARDAGVID